MLLFSADNESAETLLFTQLHTVPAGRSVGVRRDELSDFKAFVGMLRKGGGRVSFEPLPVSDDDEMLFFVRAGRSTGSPDSANIQRGVGAPPPRAMTKWPFGDMRVGDVVTYDDAKKGVLAQRYCHGFARQQSPRWQFVSRTIDGVMNIWRVK